MITGSSLYVEFSFQQFPADDSLSQGPRGTIIEITVAVPILMLMLLLMLMLILMLMLMLILMLLNSQLTTTSPNKHLLAQWFCLCICTFIY